MGGRIKSILRSFLPCAVRPQVILAGPLKGARIMTSWHDYPAAIIGRTEHPLLEWFTRNVRPGMTWLDVGAHYGYTAITLSRLVGPEGRVFAFEPMLSTAGYLTQTRLLNQLPQLVVLPFGLAASDNIELRQLPVTRGMVDSTLQHGQWEEVILVARLEWLWPQICGGSDRIDGVKIDVQGMEYDVLRGMTTLLSKWKPTLVIELHQGVDRPQLLDLIKMTGYHWQGIPIEPVRGEVEPQYVDNHSYAFLPL
jgi:FkbM family methyltransferase